MYADKVEYGIYLLCRMCCQGVTLIRVSVPLLQDQTIQYHGYDQMRVWEIGGRMREHVCVENEAECVESHKVQINMGRVNVLCFLTGEADLHREGVRSMVEGVSWAMWQTDQVLGIWRDHRTHRPPSEPSGALGSVRSYWVGWEGLQEGATGEWNRFRRHNKDHLRPVLILKKNIKKCFQLKKIPNKIRYITLCLSLWKCHTVRPHLSGPC